MALAVLIGDFLQRIALGAGAVLALLFLVRLGMPRRALIPSHRRTQGELPPR